MLVRIRASRIVAVVLVCRPSWLRYRPRSLGPADLPGIRQPVSPGAQSHSGGSTGRIEKSTKIAWRVSDAQPEQGTLKFRAGKGKGKRWWLGKEGTLDGRSGTNPTCHERGDELRLFGPKWVQVGTKIEIAGSYYSRSPRRTRARGREEPSWQRHAAAIESVSPAEGYIASIHVP